MSRMASDHRCNVEQLHSFPRYTFHRLSAMSRQPLQQPLHTLMILIALSRLSLIRGVAKLNSSVIESRRDERPATRSDPKTEGNIDCCAVVLHELCR